MARTQDQESPDKIAIKGTREGLVVTIAEGEWDDLVDQLSSHLQRKAAFFGGAHAILDTGTRQLAVEDLRQICELFSANGMHMCGIRTESPETMKSAAALQIPASKGTGVLDRGSELRPNQTSESALFVKRTIRSGQMLQYLGHLTIIGDVNPGAEVVAGGDIIVWGKLRGTVHAGAQGDDSAIVCALSLAPTQLRIGNHIARPPETDKQDRAVPEIAQVDEEGIIVEPWDEALRRTS